MKTYIIVGCMSVTGKAERSVLWPDAVQQGMYAAFSMVGIEKKYPGILILESSNFFGVPFVSCGTLSHKKASIESGNAFYHKFIKTEDQLRGFLMIGKIKNIGVLRSAMLNKAGLS
ncbi:hypothetical protein KAW80_02770 [Candidatus Babeliales bacterium]|nr:hypothetical protein [Candidatus Babeliales bacterium]